ncbi:LysR family transcriptional regulator [Bacillus shivajii]|uniref:LysR family transcriptional regulator n=1 Tax=Bacillus shivajii TaxID=1983719 RepID=UPI001CF94D85|nr:LysR family transcriptional regulator [Bacillus shivajii]UCZ53624.1 LysR family transcriptional regulator [Bacillus shivajii]
MKVEEYELIIALYECGTIRGAAESLLISQPAVSQRLKQVENDWGVNLFIRTPRKLVPTKAGEKVFAHAKKVVEEEKNVRNEIESEEKEIGGTLSLGVSSLIGQYILPPILEKYIEKYPKVKVELKTGLSQTIKENVNHYHLTIVRGEFVRGQECKHLFSDQLYLIDRADKFTSNCPRPFVEFQADDSLKSVVRKWLSEQRHIKVAQTIRVDQIETCKQLMRKGVGLSVLPKSAVDDLGDGFVKVPLEGTGEQLVRETWVCYQNKVVDLPQVREFLNELNSMIRK